MIYDITEILFVIAVTGIQTPVPGSPTPHSNQLTISMMYNITEILLLWRKRKTNKQTFPVHKTTQQQNQIQVHL